MKTQRLLSVIILFGLIMAPLAAFPAPVKAQATYTCLPTCATNDARFLTIAGTGLATMVGLDVSLKIGSRAGSPTVEIGIFDGDISGTWDIPAAVVTTFTLYADPIGNADESIQLAQWTSTGMPDNAWFTQILPNNPAARAPSGNYFYHLKAHVDSTALTFYNNYKVRSDGLVSLLPKPFAFYASLNNSTNIVYPNFPDLSTTTYDGTFDFHVMATHSLTRFRLWDGDMDFGKYDLTLRDTDDPDTPATPPAWATAGTANEGVAVGSNGSTGAPSDDNNFIYYVRSPSVRYSVSPLDQTPYWNENPSGNMEWEQFKISSDPSEAADYHVSGLLPAGLYHIHVEGMDMNNLNAWRFPWEILGVCETEPGGDPNPCFDIKPYLIGDYVWADANQDGIQDPGEAPIPGVRVELFDSTGAPLLDVNNNPRYAITDANGLYTFEVDGYTVDPDTGEVSIDGIYTVRVAASNFQTGGPLEGMHSTTGGETHTETVTTANVLTYDFGYWAGRPNTEKRGPYLAGWWRRHADRWPQGPFVVGGVSYTNEQAMVLFWTPGRRDMTYRVAWQALATTMNVAKGYESSCITADLATANQWLTANPVGSGVLASDAEWTSIQPTVTKLMQYNAARLCARRNQQ